MSRIEDNNVIQAFSSHGTDHSLHIGVLPRASKRRRAIANAHGGELFFECRAKDGVIIPDQMFGRGVPRKSFNKLLSCPFCRRVICDGDM